MNLYVRFVTDEPILSAVVQFAVLGTFGEIVSKWVRKKSFHYPFNLSMTIWKMIVWSILAVCINYAFVGIDGFVRTLIEYKMLPELSPFVFAFAKSVMINLQFGLFLVIFHRVLDNLPEKVKTWQGLDKGMLSLLWFWIPAHTITFCLPEVYQIGLAAVWSVVLGFILGLFNLKL